MELRMEHLYKFYRKKEALHDVDVTLQTGVYGLLGENGAGKSTLMRIMSTADCPSKGTIRCDGRDIFEMDEEYRDLIGYMPQLPCVSGIYGEGFSGIYGDFKGDSEACAEDKDCRGAGVCQSGGCGG